MSAYRKILVPFDFSVHARAALDAAIDLGRHFGSDIDVVHVLQNPIFPVGYAPHTGASLSLPFEMKAIREDAERALQGALAQAPAVPGKIETEICEGTNIAGTIEATARRRGSDLIVMGTHGRTGLAHVFVGSVAERVIRSAPCAVLTVQAEEADSGAERDAETAD